MLAVKIPVALINNKTKIDDKDDVIKIGRHLVLFAVDGHYPRSKILHAGVLEGRPLPVARKPVLPTEVETEVAEIDPHGCCTTLSDPTKSHGTGLACNGSDNACRHEPPCMSTSLTHPLQSHLQQTQVRHVGQNLCPATHNCNS